MTNKALDTLVQDIYSVVDEGLTVDENLLAKFLDDIGNVIKNRLQETKNNNEVEKKPTLRLSKIGTPNRKLWFEHHFPLNEEEKKILPSDRIKFMYGDIVEALLIFLIRQAGHSVEGEQEELTVNGVVGHRDCKINGTTVDIKSTSKFAFEKFKRAKLFEDDPFGYVAQLSAYCHADKSDRGAFLAVNKESGELCLLDLAPIDMINPVERIDEMRDALKSPEPPISKCYEPVAMGKSGNLELNKNCTYCPFKYECWKDANNGRGIRKFEYSTGTKYLVQIDSEPTVPETI